MTVDANRVSLLPCPLCDSTMAWSGDRYHHPDSIACPLVGASFRGDTADAWNRRSPSLSGGEVVKSAWPPLVELGRVLGFFASAVKSGEPWTETCQAEYAKANAALQSLYASPAPDIIAAKDAEIEELREQLRVWRGRRQSPVRSDRYEPTLNGAKP